MATDEDALRELAAVSNVEAIHRVLNYLYFPNQEDAEIVADMLRKEGFSIEQRLGADNVHWLVLASTFIIPNEKNISAMRNQLERVAEAYSGEYDGWEARIGRKRGQNYY